MQALRGKDYICRQTSFFAMTIKEKFKFDSQPVYLMDGTAFIYRAFYSNRHLQRSDGFPTNALVVVTRTLLRILRQEKPAYLLFAMDGRGGTFRNEIYDRYKANREAMPEELALQIEPVCRMVDALGIRREVARGFEADDCIASLAARFRGSRPVVIVSGDKDLKQCLAPDVIMWDPGVKDEKILTMADFEAESGVSPAQWPDVQAIVGDSSDNIPGVPGIGPKTAKIIFEICPTLEAIKKDFSLLPDKIQAKLAPHLDEMFKWRELTTLRLDECPEITLDDLQVGDIHVAKCESLADEFELASVRREIASLQKSRMAASGMEVKSERINILENPVTGGESQEARQMSWPSAVEADKNMDLPSCAGMNVAVIWPEGKKSPPRAAIGSPDIPEKDEPFCQPVQEYEWRGSQADLCQWLAGANLVITADLKNLLASSPSWRRLAFENGAHFMDLGLASYLLNPEDGDYSWARLANRWREPLKCEGSGPAALALAMRKALEKSLQANGLAALYENMEMPLVLVLAQMEGKGVAIDPAAFQGFLKDVQGELDGLTHKVYELAGESFNIRSAQKLGEILFAKLGLPEPKKTKTGQPSTSQAVLEKLAPENPIVESILQIRKLEKMRSTYLDPLPRLMDANNRLHTTFNQEATATGRLSSSNPNLQNIPVRGPLGARMRACFTAAPGNLLLSADYSQIELRILAHLSRDRTLIDAFAHGRDIHAATAALIFESEAISPDQRRMAKTINFGLLYGMGAQKLAQELKITTPQAKNFMERYFEKLGDLKLFYEKIIEEARQHGYVTTMAGRRRWLPGIFSANGQAVAQAQRQAVNTVIQGSAADVIKLAMLAVASDRELEAMDARLVLQVHDELLLEAPQANAEKACARVAAIMESAQPGGQPFSVPLLVDWGIGPNWGVAH